MAEVEAKRKFEPIEWYDGSNIFLKIRRVVRSKEGLLVIGHNFITGRKEIVQTIIFF